MGFADLHIHSVHSHDGTCSIPAILKFVADRTNLDVIAITDHDKVTGLREALALGPKYGIEVVPGVEVSTAQGHLLALFVTQPIRAGMSLRRTLEMVGELGGLAVAPHPDAPGISGLRSSVIRAAAADPELAKVLVGVETHNSGLVYARTNKTAEALGCGLGLACVGSSDSHILGTIGQGTTEFEGRTAADLRKALEAHDTIAHPALGLQGPIVLGHWFPRFALRKMGWVAWNADPQQPLRYVRSKQAVWVASE